MYENLKFEVKDKIAFITINRTIRTREVCSDEVQSSSSDA